MLEAGDDLSRFRWHTGAALRPLAPGERCPPLFRDLGPAALARFLRRALPRLAGPLSPITYLRTAAFREPYTDHEAIGRIIVLQPRALQPWHSGVPEVFVAKATPGVDHGIIGFVPGAMDLARVGERTAGMRATVELREELGGAAYDGLVAHELSRLDGLERELAETETTAAPLRARLQGRDAAERQRAREAMARAGIEENDLCAAWHHLPRDRRGAVREALARIAGGAAC